MNEDEKKLLADREARAKELLEMAAETAEITARLNRANAAADLNESAAELARSTRRHEQREAAHQLMGEADEMKRTTARMERASAAAELKDLADETKELTLSLEELGTIAAQAMAFRASLPDTDPESPNFNYKSIKDMSRGEKQAKKEKCILKDWERVLKDPPVINGRTCDDIINTADYETELAGKHQFRYEATSDADDFQVKMLELYHGGFMYAGEDEAYRITRRIHGGPLFSYISNCKELKEFMIELHGFWKEHTESYRTALVEESSTSDKSLSTSAKSVQHHKKVEAFCERVSKADAREHTQDNTQRQELSCIYEMHRVADDDEDDFSSAMIRRKIGKIHSDVNSITSYFRDSKASRRNPFMYDEEDESPPHTAVDGNILCFIERDGTLFDRSKYLDLSNYLVEFVEVFTTAALIQPLTSVHRLNVWEILSVCREMIQIFLRECRGSST